MAETTRFGRRITQVVEMGDRNVLLPRRYEDVLDRVNELIEARSNTLPALMRTAQMMDGGERAVAALLAGHHDHKLKDMPIANYMRDAAEAFAGRLAAIPDLRVDPPSTGRASDENETRTRSAEKRARIVASYDDDLADGVAERIPMMARWVPGAGYAVWTIRPIMVNGFPYPRSELRNPLDTALAQWTPVTRPEDCGFVYTKPVKQLVHEYPEHAHRLSRNDEASGMSGAVLLDRHRDGLGVTVVEYHDRNGTWWLVPGKQLLLDFVENPLESGPAFEAFTKFNYNRLRGEYDDMIGPMISMARLHILSELAIRKDVAQPTNLFTGPGGALSGPYKQGFNKVNIFDPNARVEIPPGSAQFQAWHQLDRLERQLRIEGQAPLQDSGESPMSFVTGRGMNALTERVERTVREYQRVFKAGLQRLDAKRLEYDERSWPDISKPMQGVRQGAAFSESYKPSTHIKGNYRCVAPGSLVLTADLRWVPAGDLTLDDLLIGFDRKLNHGRGRSTPMQPSAIEGLGARDMECVRVVTNRGEITVSLEHKFVVRERQHRKDGIHVPTRRAWREAQHLQVGDSLIWLMEPWKERRTYEAGYVSGILDGEGSLDRSRTSFAQRPGPVLDQSLLYLKQMGYEVNVYPGAAGKNGDVTSAKIGGGAYEQMRLLGELRPARLLEKSHVLWNGRGMVTKGRGDRGRSEVVVEAVEFVGPREVVTMQTSTRTFISEGFASHNTRREYGAMASVDEAVRLNGLALMQQLGWTSAKWSRTQLDELGIPDTQMEEQIRHERAEEAFQQMLLMAVNNPEHPEHMRALQLVVESLPQGRTRDLAEKWLTERGEELAEAEEAMLGMGQPAPAPQDVLAALAGGGGAGPDPVSLARVTQGGEAQGGTQLVARGARGEG